MKTGRNEPCPCGSGKKFKKCCLDATRPVRQRAPTPERDPGVLAQARTMMMQQRAGVWRGRRGEGMVYCRSLCESPFTDIAPAGPNQEVPLSGMEITSILRMKAPEPAYRNGLSTALRETEKRRTSAAVISTHFATAKLSAKIHTGKLSTDRPHHIQNHAPRCGHGTAFAATGKLANAFRRAQSCPLLFRLRTEPSGERA